jgi:hypothetical protein
MRNYLAPALLLFMFISIAAPARLIEATGSGDGSEDVKTLVIDKVVVNKTPRGGPWLICFTATHGDDEVTFNVPNRKFEGSGVEIVLGVEVPEVRKGDGIRWDMKLDDEQANVCSDEAGDRSSGRFSARRVIGVLSCTGTWSEG